MCNAYECPFRNEMGYCKVTACMRRDLAEKYNSFYTTDYAMKTYTIVANSREIEAYDERKGGDE